jgi:hemoglobin
VQNRESAVSPFNLIGGESGVRALMTRFYDLMDSEPAYAGIRRLHPADLSATRDKLFWFMCGWLGGPQHYVERFGHPMLRARHLHAAIGVDERDQWMSCMQRAMAESGVDPALQQHLVASLFKTADWMRNRPEDHASLPGAPVLTP